ncbi:hypothetical protein PTUN_a1847 [Pseudoalteromonas tunicata]|nr:hypothetical protein PTUN_a1847 [Pseudoalteromonas tunicata]
MFVSVVHLQLLSFQNSVFCIKQISFYCKNSDKISLLNCFEQ